jgi:hypothetical protein
MEVRLEAKLSADPHLQQAVRGMGEGECGEPLARGPAMM